MHVLKCVCGAEPIYEEDRASEDCMEGRFICEACGKHSDPVEHIWGGDMMKELAADQWNEMVIEELRKTPIKPGQVWRKKGPYGWLKVENILDPKYPEYPYDGGLIGCSASFFPPQTKGILLKRGKRFFIPGSRWEREVRENRFPLRDEKEPNLM